MASFVSANLDHELVPGEERGFVKFKLDMKLRFEPKEVGHRWLLQVEFMEADPLRDDPIKRQKKSVDLSIQPDVIRRYIEPSAEEVEHSFEEELPADLVDTEMGKEEVYANLELKPTGDAPADFVPAKTRTNITQVDV